MGLGSIPCSPVLGLSFGINCYNPSSILAIIMHVCPHDHLATDTNVDTASVMYTLLQYGIVFSLCCPCEVCVSSALHYIHTTICWYVHCHLTMFTDMLLMWAAHIHTRQPFLFCPLNKVENSSLLHIKLRAEERGHDCSHICTLWLHSKGKNQGGWGECKLQGLLYGLSDDSNIVFLTELKSPG